MGLVGLISDTHGLVRPAVFGALEGVQLILHAGDVGEGVIPELQTIAPVRAVYGNTDPAGCPGLAESIDFEMEGVSIHVSHGHELGSPTPEKLLATYPADVIVYGHTHKPFLAHVDGRWVVNPGAAGPQRFKLKPSVARMSIRQGSVAIQIVELPT